MTLNVSPIRASLAVLESSRELKSYPKTAKDEKKAYGFMNVIRLIVLQVRLFPG